MKTTTKIIAIAILLSIFNNAKAQWTNSFPYLYNTTENIGIGTTTPGQLLQVSGGNIDVKTATKGYMIADTLALWQPTNSSLLVGKTGNSGVGLIYSTAVGYAAGNKLTATSYNCTFLGALAGYRDSLAANSTCIGAYSGQNNTVGDFNTFVGAFSGNKNTYGGNNNFFGVKAGYNTVNGSSNVAMGNNAMYTNKNGGGNVFIGNFSGQNDTASYNTGVGINALYTNTKGDANVALGAQALKTNTIGRRNTATGDSSLFNNTTGNYNTASGYGSGLSVTSGSSNTFLGYNANTSGTNAATLTNATAIGSNANVTTNNNMILGDNNTNIGIGLSGNASGPQNKLEINAASANLSGLRFRQLTSGSTPGTNPGSGVLALNSSGDVVYVSGTSGGTFGNICGGTQVPLANNWEVPLGGHSFIFSGQNASDLLGIGISGCSPIGKLDLLYNTGSPVAYNASSFGIHAINSNTGASLISTGSLIYGVYGEASASESSNSIYHYGGAFKATNSYDAVGVSAVAVANPGNLFTSKCYGGYFNASSSAASTVYGVYATVSGGSTMYAGYFNGDVYVNGPNSGMGYLTVSDKQFKTQINTISNPTDIIKKLQPKSYYYDTANTNGMRFFSEKQYGFLAQDLQQVLPEMVHTVTKPEDVDADGKVITASVTHLTVNYNGFIALLTAAMQQQQTKVDSLTTVTSKQDSINKALQNQINQIVNTCCNKPNGTGNRTINNNNSGSDTTGSNNKTATTQINVQLSNADVVVLNQNQPNPFAEQTLITYNIPQNAGFAQILFYDVNGRQIKTVDITTKGKGQLNVYANDLTNGMYSYTLIVDGKIIDTKKMVKQ
jgi:hypothetical protein